MKKHFLLLVMALMSLTGWAQTATIGEVAIGEYTYGAWALPTDAVVKDSEGAILAKGTHYEISKGAFSDEACTTPVEKANLKADGTTKYYRLITGIGAYSGQKKAVWFKVAKANATIHLKDALSKYYGATNPTIPTADDAYTIKYKQATSEDAAEDVDITAQFEGTLAYSYEGSNAGTHALTFSGITPKATGIGGNFNLVTTDVITINRLDISKTATITAWQGDVEYTGNPFVGVYTVKDKAEGGIVLTAGTPAVAATSTTPAVAATGDYYVDAVTNVKWTSAGAVAENCPTIHFQGNYTGTLPVAEGKGFKVTPAPLTVTVEDFKVDYDNKDHAVLKDLTATTPVAAATGLKFVYSGFLGADIQPTAKEALISGFTEVPTKVAYDGEAKNAGEYALTISGGSAGKGNYEFKNYLPGKLIINKKKYELTSKSTSKQIGEKDPTFELNAEPVLVSPDDKLSGITFDREKGETVGKYTITPVVTAAKVTRTEKSGKTTDVTANYEFVAAKTQGQLTITEAGIVISIKDASKKYGAVDPGEFEYTVIGLQEGDVLDKVTVTRDKAGTTAGEAVGAYLLSAEAPANPNKDKYASVTVVPAIFTIEQAELEITMPTQNVAKDTGKATDLKKDGITATGINNTDKIADLIGAPAFASGVSVSTDKTYPNGYSVSLTTAAGKNYKITKVNGVAVLATATSENPNTAATAYGKLIVGNGDADPITLNRVAKADFEDPAKNTAAKLIAEKAGETLTVKFSDFEMLPEKWYPIVLPFETTVSDISRACGYAVVNVLNKDNTDASKVSFKLHMGTLPANTPFVVKVYGTKANDYKVNMNSISLTGKIVAPADYERVTTEDAKDKSGITFIGTYKGKTDGFRANQWYFSASAALNQYYPGNDTNTTYLRPLGAYLEATTAGARILEFEEADGTITAISSMKAENEAASAEGWYTIGGVKLEGAPSQKGIYIQNGKKVIVK